MNTYIPFRYDVDSSELEKQVVVHIFISNDLYFDR